ncbi:MAG TPA: glycosyltransferase family 2 protein [Casimicrobiaceae bacterium]|nr:glycosyltransferase family 2 protein [Casimicrobiaceae bacterium]
MTTVSSVYSLIIPVYRNRESLPELLEQLCALQGSLSRPLETLFVVDGSPDDSYAWLRTALPDSGLDARLILLARNFGSFAAITAGLAEATGEYFAVLAADLQDPPDIVREFFAALEGGEVDVVVGTRQARADPWLSRVAASWFWALYRRVIEPQIPRGGVDLFGCNRAFRDQLIRLREANTSLVALLFWLGFRRRTIGYVRRPRPYGSSAWTLKRKLKYLSDSIFAFSDLPVRLLFYAGIAGLLISVVFGMVVLFGRLTGAIELPGYSATVLVILFFGALNAFGLGVVGAYAWRAYENTKQRPGYLVLSSEAIPTRNANDDIRSSPRTV